MFDENERRVIETEAQSLLKRFGERLAGLDLPDIVSQGKESGMRRASQNKAEPGFRDVMFANAPHKDGDCILAEKKQW